MSRWGTATAAQRRSAPAGTFCGTNNSFPVADQEDVNNAVRALGRAGGDTAPIKSCIIRKAKANNWTLPQAWMSAGTPVATFALDDASVNADTVTRRGLVFRAGDYPDKQFAATIEDLYAAATSFVPVANDLEHVPTLLSGKLGMLTSVSLSESGEELYGEVEIPRWLHDTIGDVPIKSSLSWDRESMQIVGNALVLEPRVEDAALMTAYTAFTASQPNAHPPTVVVPATTPAVQTATLSEDAAVGLLATMRALLTGHDPKPPSVVPGTVPPPQAATAPTGAEEAPVTESVGTLQAARAITFAETEDFKKMQAQIDAQNAQLAAFAAREQARERDFIAERAATFADAEITALRAVPAERDGLVAAFTDAATDDSSTPRTVTFSVNGEQKEGSRVDALRARQAARSPHTLTKEQVAEGTVLMAQRPANTAPVKMSAERKVELLVASGFSANS